MQINQNTSDSAVKIAWAYLNRRLRETKQVTDLRSAKVSEKNKGALWGRYRDSKG